MKPTKKTTTVFILLSIISITLIFNSCENIYGAILEPKENLPSDSNSDSDIAIVAVVVGNYYLDGDKDNAYIQIIDSNTLKFVNFDIDYLANYLVYEGTDYRGKDAEDFMLRQNLPDVFKAEIEFDFNGTDNYIYVKALKDSNEDSVFTVNYRMKYENENTISFMEEIYIRYDPTDSAI